MPLTVKTTAPEYGSPISDPRYLTVLKDPFYRCLVDLQDLISYETAAFWRSRNVRSVHLPVTTGSISSPMGLGSDSLPVQVDLFGVPVYLADSMQFMLEYGCRLTDSGCYYLMPSFRGEDTDATHLSQFFHSEAEIPGSLGDVIETADAYIRHLASAIVSELADPVRQVVGGTEHIEKFLASPTTPMTFDEAVDELGASPEFFEFHDEWRTIKRAGERRLLEHYGPAVWLSHFDHLSVPFYQAADASGQKALNADFLLGPGEVMGCGERHLGGAEVRAALTQHHVAEEEYAWYVGMKDHHPLRTSGFGMGVERFLMWVLNHSDIRDLQLVERINGVVTAP
ncbi:amino acid--tRNA ligase-related protein [Streptomyces sp. 8L]|uniref:amino acid--tRNA ligase-related protein n=1 Tax=Streptomyces sp. 8L TaxID=2877242 RepID=UPI001CD5CF77|nr:amino acid--tRNA ligase-related protein [Streptomyces sp. 8L]MCA1221456.1 asparaginase [Streptomyces sp. 8L]